MASFELRIRFMRLSSSPVGTLESNPALLSVVLYSCIDIGYHYTLMLYTAVVVVFVPYCPSGTSNLGAGTQVRVVVAVSELVLCTVDLTVSCYYGC